MKDRQLFNFLLITAFAVNSCVPRRNVHIENTSPITPTPSLLSPTPEPTIIQAEVMPPTTSTPPTPELTIRPPTVEERFRLGEIDFADTPFKITSPSSFRELLGHVFAADTTYSADIPLAVKVPFFGDIDQRETFDRAAKDNSDGNPYYVLLSSEANHILIYSHSYQRSAPGDLAREVGGFVDNHPDKLVDVIGSILTLNVNGRDYAAEIVNVVNISGEYFGNLGEGSPWGVYRNENDVLFGRTDILGIPDSIRTNQEPGVFFITIIGCQNENPGEVDLFGSDDAIRNTAMRTLLTLKIVLP